MTALALGVTHEDELRAPGSGEVPTEQEVETLDEAIAEINLQLAGAHHHSLALADRREDLLMGRAELRRRRERAGLFGAGVSIRFYSIDYVGTVAEYEEHDPKLMRGDGQRQVWPPGGLEKICSVKVRR